MNTLSQFSDSELYSICKKWGREALAARRRFAGLLPEVYRREMESKGGGGGMAGRTQAEPGDEKIEQLNLSFSQNTSRTSWLEKRGYTCLYEFAARLAGMSRKQVDLVMRLDQRFADIPVLRAALVEGKISANKLVRVASIATVENQNELLMKLEILSSRALEIYVRELKIKNGHTGAVGFENDCADALASQFENQSEKENANGNKTENENLNCFNKTNIDQKVLHVHHFDTWKKDSEPEDETTDKPIDVTHEITHDATPNTPIDTTPDADLLAVFSLELKHKIRELKAKGIDVNDLFMEFLQKRENEIQEEMEKLGREQLQVRLEKHIIGKPASRHVSVKIERIIRAQYGDVCSAAGCMKPAEHIHHEKKFASFGNHDPRFLRPLCKAHHELVHAGEGDYARFRGGG